MPDAGSPSTRHRTIRIDCALDAAVEELAHRKFSTPSQVVRQALAEHVARERRVIRRAEQDDEAQGDGR